jgi:hypothetical protein
MYSLTQVHYTVCLTFMSLSRDFKESCCIYLCIIGIRMIRHDGKVYDIIKECRVITMIVLCIRMTVLSS